MFILVSRNEILAVQMIVADYIILVVETKSRYLLVRLTTTVYVD